MNAFMNASMKARMNALIVRLIEQLLQSHLVFAQYRGHASKIGNPREDISKTSNKDSGFLQWGVLFDYVVPQSDMIEKGVAEAME
jgi:hypothetical protein